MEIYILTKLPTLYHQGKKGKVYSWDVSYNDPTFGHITTIYGTVDGEKTTTTKLVEQKNVGKANETSLEQQAENEARSMWQNKLDRKYSQNPDVHEEETKISPMLAKDYAKEKKKIKWPAKVYVQPKLDGTRAIAYWDDDRVVLMSRSNKEYTAVPHINKVLESILPKYHILDGELYVHGVDFQTTVSWIKKNRPESTQVQYHIYDMPQINEDHNLSWEDRLSGLLSWVEGLPDDYPIKLVTTYEAESDELVHQLHNDFVTEGYEGAIVRLPEGKYLYGYRSNELLKVKEFDDAEFEVTGYKRGTGRYENAVIWACKTKDGKEFDCNPKVTLAEKEEFLKNAKTYIGKMLTVRYFGLTNDGIPRFPVGIKFRLEEDIS